MSKYRCELYVTIDVSESAAVRLAAALDAAKISAVMIAPAANRALDAAVAKPLVDLAQAKGVAALIYGDATLAQALRADGVHLPPSLQLADDYASARKILGPHAMIGVDAGSSRHTAMELAEAGTDYIALSAIDHTAAHDADNDSGSGGDTGPDTDDPETDLDGTDDDDIEEFGGIDLISWWVDVFQTPCVALDVSTAALATEVAQEGCEFINITLEAGLSPGAVADFVRVIAKAANA